MKLGAEPKKIAVLGGLILLAVVLQFMGGEDVPRQSTAGKKAATPAQAAGEPAPKASTVQPVARTTTRAGASRRAAQEFKPVVKSRRPEDRIDPTTVDPTLRLELLERLNNVKIQGGNRALFEFGTAPPPKAPDPGKIVPVKPDAVKIAPPAVAATPPPSAKPAEPVKPQAPPIPLKFYGFTAARAGVKRAFFLENEDVFVANEGQLVKNRYKVVRINLNSVVMEDTQFQQQQTLPLIEQMQ